MFGITISSSSDVRPFWRLVDQASGLEPAPSIRTLGYLPHITLVRYSQVLPDRLRDAAKQLEGEKAISLTFDRIGVFDADPIVLWLSPRASHRLVHFHAKIHQAIGPALCDPHYRPGGWVPHLTIAMAIPTTRRSDALELAARPLEPFTLTFHSADCVSWPPVRVVYTVPLRR